MSAGKLSRKPMGQGWAGKPPNRRQRYGAGRSNLQILHGKLHSVTGFETKTRTVAGFDLGPFAAIRPRFEPSRRICLLSVSLQHWWGHALLSIAGCAQYVGKGKAPPPVVTKG